MIIAKSILGRLGNQMFRYAYCKAIKEAVGGNENKVVISLDRWYNDESMNIHHLNFKDFITISCGKTK